MAIAPAESPSGHSTSSSARTSTSRHGTLSSAATTPRSARSPSPPVSLSLKSYVPVGCLVLSLPDFVSRSEAFPFSEIHLSSEDGCLILASLTKNLATCISQLATALWIRLEWGSLSDGRHALRIYVLPEDSGNLIVDRSRLDRKLQQAMEQLLSHVDTSPEIWVGVSSTGQCPQKFDLWATSDDRSLQYIFNTLPSPDPDEGGIQSRQARLAFEQAFYDEVPGLKVNLYPYQRRSVAAMISRETCTTLRLDPRLEPRNSPDGSTYYYNPRSMTISKQPRMYESSPSGILAEAMGHGKTVICLALILATRHHLPQIPPQYIAEVPLTPSMGTRSLARTAAIQAGAHALSIKAHKALQYGFDSVDSLGVEKLAEEHLTSYLIYPTLIRRNRRTQLPPPVRKIISSTTIVVVPRHLTNQWKSEIAKHTMERSLKVLYMLSSKQALLPACELMQYDIILFSKYRFEFENRDGRDRNGRLPGEIPECRCPYIGATRTVNCTCPTADDFYRSPLRDLHWLRIIIDEGHEFATKKSNAVEVATRLVTAERRWVVSGTPAKDKLLGVEVDTSLARDVQTLPTEDSAKEAYPDTMSADDASKATATERRTRFNREEEKFGAAKGIGLLASNFLNVHPWSGCDIVDNALWEDFVFRHEGRGHSYSSFAPCLSRTLEAMVIRTRPDDLEVILPPLHSKVVKLEPCFLDRLTMNMFLFVVASNAITSERTDVDYLFHPNSRGPRYRLVCNLRQSAFCWTGFAEEEVQSSIDTAMRYLDKPNTKCTWEDREALLSFVAFGKRLLQNKAWLALGASHEVGATLDHWPEHDSCSWSLLNEDSEGSGSPTHMTGLTQVLRAQTMLDYQLFEDEPLHNFAKFGKLIVEDALKAREKDASSVNKKSLKKDDESDNRDVKENDTDLVMSAAVHDRYKPQTSMVHSPMTPKRTTSKAEGKNETDSPLVQTLQVLAKRKRSSSLDTRALPAGSPLATATISATTSAKMSYLISRITALHSSEKILVFYDGNDVAWYIAQFLELLHIQHRIYAKGLDQAKQADYIVEFDRNDSIRVLLIDIRCGALGLNINAASRIYFVNPPCRPYLEAQAKKRCHRIGQTKPVFVETLVLKDTIEEAMYERSQRMSHKEHQGATHLEDDDEIADIIKNARMVPLDWSISNLEQQYAKFEDGLKLQIFGREGRAAYREAEAAAEQKTIKRRKLDNQARARNTKSITA